MRNGEFIYNLIELDYHGKLDKQQREELHSWLNLSQDNISEYNKIIKLFTYSDRLVSMKKIDTDRDLLLVRKKLNGKRKLNNLFLNFQKVAAVLIIPLLLYTAWTIFGRSGNDNKSNIIKSTETTFGIRSQIQLSDGTEVWLNSGSKLSYPEEFNGKSREVKLVGEAYFHVKSDREHPFYVDLDGHKIEVTGTSFNISNYPDDREISIYLEQGKVSLLMNTKEVQSQPVKLNEKEVVILNKAEKQYRIQKADGNKYLAWIDGKLVLKNDHINDVAVRLGRWFNAEVTFDDELSRSGYVFTATFKKESLEEALKLLSYSSPITYQIIQGAQMDDSSFSKRKVIISKR
ncbi:MAG: FecR family protein [Mangrovibacterium sp.]